MKDSIHRENEANSVLHNPSKMGRVRQIKLSGIIINEQKRLLKYIIMKRHLSMWSPIPDKIVAVHIIRKIVI